MRRSRPRIKISGELAQQVVGADLAALVQDRPRGQATCLPHLISSCGAFLPFSAPCPEPATGANSLVEQLVGEPQRRRPQLVTAIQRSGAAQTRLVSGAEAGSLSAAMAFAVDQQKPAGALPPCPPAASWQTPSLAHLDRRAVLTPHCRRNKTGGNERR